MSTIHELFDLRGRTALVTGGATGLGYHMARALVRGGAHALIVGRRREVLETAAQQIAAEQMPGSIDWLATDLQDRHAMGDLIENMRRRRLSVDIFIGNAGVTNVQQLDELDLRVVDQTLQLNLLANMQLAQAFVPAMRAKRWGRFIFSSSVASQSCGPLEGTSAYAASKAALNAFCRQLAVDLGRHGITANTLVLGFYTTEILNQGVSNIRASRGEDAARRFIDEFTSVTALGRFGDPAEIEGIVHLLASNAGSYITGASIVVDGGMSAMMRPLAIGAVPTSSKS
jgi:gluconate 5-dehydrogenase